MVKSRQGAGFPAELPAGTEPVGTQATTCQDVVEKPARDRRDTVKVDT